MHVWTIQGLSLIVLDETFGPIPKYKSRLGKAEIFISQLHKWSKLLKQQIEPLCFTS